MPVAVGLLILAIAAVAVWAWRHCGEPRRQLTGQFAEAKKAAKKSEQQAEADLLPEMRNQVGQVAKERDIPLAMTANGQNPTIVGWADGQTSMHYADFATYKRDMNSGRADRMRSRHGAFNAVPVSRWTKVQLVQSQMENAN